MLDGKPLLFDLFCGSGGAARGYTRAGFEVVGVDVLPQEKFVGHFVRADVFKVLDRLLSGGKVIGFSLDDVDVIHASPPCQQFSSLAKARGDGTDKKYPNLIPETRSALLASGKLFVIENITRAPLSPDAVLLCGTMFGDMYMWHRKFECNFPVKQLECDHNPATTYNSPFTMPNFNRIKKDFGSPPGPEARFRLMKGITWTKNQREGREALPPVYTEYIGKELMRYGVKTPPLCGDLF